MKRILAIIVCVLVSIGITSGVASSSTPDRPVAPIGSKVAPDAGVVSVNAEPTLIQGWDNINWEHAIIVSLSAPPCDNSSDVDYAMNTLGNNNNQLSSIQLNPASNCALVLWDGPGFTGNSTFIPVGTGGCMNLGSCFGENLWKRVNSLQLL